jgi:hypothetical protein
MTTYSNIDNDDGAANCFVVTYAPGCLGALPWRDEKFDCLIFNLSDDDLMEQAVDELLAKNCDWIHTAGEGSKYWHDYIDQRSVDLGRQAAVGDGNPMTAWHEEITDFLKLKLTVNFGGNDYFLIVLVGLAEIKGVMETLKKINQERFQTLKGINAKQTRLPVAP